jgi:hypothetical protein
MAKTITIDLEKIYSPQPRQRLLHNTLARQILFGGAAGGGKSTAGRWELITIALRCPGAQCYIFRRTLVELEANHIRFIRSDLPPELGQWNENRKAFEFYNGSRIVCGYAESDRDVERYQGAEIHALLIDEAGQFTPYQISFLRSRNRLGGWAAPEGSIFAKQLPRIIMTANPGGVSHQWLKSTFIDPAPPEQIFFDATTRDPSDDRSKGWPSVFIPALMSDNKYLDKDYAGAFGGLPEELQRALREGDWDLVVGSYFGDVFRRERHVMRPFEIPRHWLRFRAYDHGSAAPFCCLWLAHASEDHETPDRLIPEGSLVVYREYYGGSNNRGLKMTAEAIASEIRSRERGDPKINYGVGDPSVWKIDGGPSIGERMMKMGITWRKADNSRIAGWDAVRRRFIGDEGVPALFFFEDCQHLIRTLPVLTHDRHRIEDVDTSLEDHAADALRYACMSRPYLTPAPVEEDSDPTRMPTLGEWPVPKQPKVARI